MLTYGNNPMFTETKEKPKYTRENPGAKAALISGPPGIGKSTVAVLLAKRYVFCMRLVCCKTVMC